MSKYTTEVRYICEHLAGLDESEGYESVNNIIDLARPEIFDFDYPIFDENYKPVLERKILKHYYTREIGLETYGLWKLKLDAKLNEIMPYYNKLYDSELIEFNPLYSEDIRIDGHKDFEENNVENSQDGGQNVVTLGGSDVSTLGGTDAIASTGSDRNVLSGSDVSTLGGSDATASTGTDRLATSGSDVSTLGGSDATASTGTDRSVLSGSDVSTLGGSNISANSGSDVDTLSGNDRSVASGSDGYSEAMKNNSWNLHSDTPQGGIYGVEGDTYNGTIPGTPGLPESMYLTDATRVINDTTGSSRTTTYGKTDTTNYGKVDTLQHGKTTTETFGKTDTTQYGKTDATTYGKTDTTSYGKTDTTQYGKTDTTTYGKTDTTSYGKTDTTQYGKTGTTTYGKTDTTTYGKTDTMQYGKTDTTAFGKTGRLTGNKDGENDYWETVRGYRGFNPSKSLQEFRKTFLNIDMMVIKELEDLFFLLW